MRSRLLFTTIVCFSLYSPAAAQSIQPENWFPLKINSYWHYEYDIGGGFIVTNIQKAAKDSLIDGKRWVAIQNVDCAPAQQFCPASVLWYRFNVDNYLLRSGNPGISPPDTVLPTTPTSFFIDTIPAQLSYLPIDTLQHTRSDAEIWVAVAENETGNEQDSTHWLLTANASTTYLLSESFIYKVGIAAGLIGAVVDSLEYGDVSRIQKIIRVGVEADDRQTWNSSFDLYPNPATGEVYVRMLRPGMIEVYDVLGRQVEKKEISNPRLERIDLQGYTPGLYIIRMEREAKKLIVR